MAMNRVQLVAASSKQRKTVRKHDLSHVRFRLSWSGTEGEPRPQCLACGDEKAMIHETLPSQTASYNQTRSAEGQTWLIFC